MESSIPREKSLRVTRNDTTSDAKNRSRRSRFFFLSFLAGEGAGAVKNKVVSGKKEVQVKETSMKRRRYPSFMVRYGMEKTFQNSNCLRGRLNFVGSITFDVPGDEVGAVGTSAF